MNILFAHAVVITGGPCVGKTTLIAELKNRGYRVLPETAREVIEESESSGSDLVPWKRLADFQTEVARRQLAREESLAECHDVCFLDRGVVDGAGYCLKGGIDIVENVLASARNRYGKVVVLEALSSYVADTCRKENAGEAAAVHTSIVQAYEMFGYRPITLPFLPPQKRIDRLLKMVQS